MRLCLLLWVLADKALTHITPSSTDHSQSIIPEDWEGGEVGREKRREEKTEIVECLPPLFFYSTLFPPRAMTKAGWKGAHCRTDGIICHYLFFFSISLSLLHTLFHSISLFPLPSALGLREMRHQTTAFLSKLSQPACSLWSDCPMPSQSLRTLLWLCVCVCVSTYFITLAY